MPFSIDIVNISHQTQTPHEQLSFQCTKVYNSYRGNKMATHTGEIRWQLIQGKNCASSQTKALLARVIDCMHVRDQLDHQRWLVWGTSPRLSSPMCCYIPQTVHENGVKMKCQGSARSPSATTFTLLIYVVNITQSNKVLWYINNPDAAKALKRCLVWGTSPEVQPKGTQVFFNQGEFIFNINFLF